mgnify:CR=1 FL=1|jgi:hypothetical protein|tara:strand:- start:1762 stop:1947 length:186 start_codon:yes stop_codon:yes gene_type:complete
MAHSVEYDVMRYQAEDIVRQHMLKGLKYEAEVTRVQKELEKLAKASGVRMNGSDIGGVVNA